MTDQVRYEYCIEWAISYGSGKTLAERLNDRGALGWRVVQTISGTEQDAEGVILERERARRKPKTRTAE